MSSNGSTPRPQPHALLFPFPAQGHINPMMQLASQLIDAGFFVTFVNTEYNHTRLLGSPAAVQPSPNLRFEHLPDGLPAWHERFNQRPAGVVETVAATLALTGTLVKLVRQIEDSADSPPLTCIVADAFFSWVQDVADIFRLPRVALWTTPVHANLAYTFQCKLQSQGTIPVTDKSKLHEIVDCVEGIVPLKLQDYISFFQIDSSADFMFQWLLQLCMKRPKDAAWNLGNNVEEFEQESCTAFRKVAPNFLPVGPLLPSDAIHGKTHNPNASQSLGITSLWPEDPTCLEWLSQHEMASVIYVSFSSVADIDEEELEELIKGLEESGSPFLWAIRPDLCARAIERLRAKLNTQAAEGKASRQVLLVSWAPQLSVLTHPSVGLFISHCGWNSVTESIAGGVPILAKPCKFAEQHMNAHYVEYVWRIGQRLPDRSSAKDIKLLIRSLMGTCPETKRIRERAAFLQQTALAAISPGGSSMSNVKLLIDDMYRRAGQPSH